MPTDLKSLNQLIQVKPEMPETTPSLGTRSANLVGGERRRISPGI